MAKADRLGESPWKGCVELTDVRRSDRPLLHVALIVVTALIFNIWVIKSANFFYADDWGWLERAAFGKWRDVLAVFPTQIYNSRPGGEFIIRLMYWMFDLDSHAYNVVLLSLHVLNCVIFYFVAAKVMPRNRAAIAAILASGWFSTLGAVRWTAAIFDLAGGTWCLLCLLMYLRGAQGGPGSGRWRWLLGAALMHVLAIRTKEFALALIVVLVSWEYLLVREADLRQRLARLAPHLAITLVYSVVYLRLYAADKSFVSSGPYQLSVSFHSIASNVVYYFDKAFYVSATDLKGAIVGWVLAGIVLLLGFTSRAALAGVLSATALMAAVLLMPHQQSPLYLYVPHFFVAMTLCSILTYAKRATIATAALVAAFLAWPVYSHEWLWSSDFTLINGAYSKGLFEDFVRINGNHKPPKQLTIAVSRTYFDPFSWGHGSALRVYYSEQTIKVNVLDLSKQGADACANVPVACLVERSGHLEMRHWSANE